MYPLAAGFPIKCGIRAYSGCIEVNMSRIVVQESRCKGCLLCTTVCPEELLQQSQRLNASGFRVVETSREDGCTGCAFCAEICPDYAITVYRSRKGAKEPTT